MAFIVAQLDQIQQYRSVLLAGKLLEGILILGLCALFRNGLAIKRVAIIGLLLFLPFRASPILNGLVPSRYDYFREFE